MEHDAALNVNWS